jgi:hypothetical protein
MKIEQLVPAESGWKAVFKEPDGGETLSRILGWAILAGKDSDLVGMIVDPAEPSRIVAATDAASPGGGGFARYRYVPPQPLVVTTAAPAAPEKKPEPEEDPATQIAKKILKRRI